MSKVAERKSKLRDDLLNSAEQRIAQNGVDRLRARDLAADVGCSVGAIYNAFDDLDALILHISLRTLKRIDQTMGQVNETRKDVEAVECLVELGWAYHRFVLENTHLWRALFEHELPADYPLPEWVLDGQTTLFRHIRAPLSHYMQEAEQDHVVRTALALFGAVHGIVTLSVEQRTTGLHSDAVADQIEFIVRTFVDGLVAGPQLKNA